MLNKKKNIITALFLACTAGIIVHGCKKDEPLPPNPYDNVNYGGSNPPEPPDPNSIVGIHNNILFTRCAKSGCHDGHFEPDFRTVESSYSTLVYHRVKKNSLDSSYTFRVVPKDTAKSVLHKRITLCNFASTAGCDRMPQDIIGSSLPQAQIDNIVNWIMNGAKDMFGNTPTYPNTSPKILYYFATDAGYAVNYGAANNRMDSIYYNPFYAPNNSTLNLLFFVEDDSTAVQSMQVNKLKISLKHDDFSSPVGTYTATYMSLPPSYKFHLVSLNTASLPNSDTLFMRYYVNDGDHAQDTEFPTTNLVFPYKTYWSFFIKP